MTYQLLVDKYESCMNALGHEDTGIKVSGIIAKAFQKHGYIYYQQLDLLIEEAYDHLNSYDKSFMKLIIKDFILHGILLMCNYKYEMVNGKKMTLLIPKFK